MKNEMRPVKADLSIKIFPEPADHFDRLPDSLLLLVFNRIGDVKALGRCCVVSRRFHSLVSQVENIVVRVDCVISDDEPSSSPSSTTSNASNTSSSAANKSRSLLRLFLSSLFKPIDSFKQFINTNRRPISSISHEYKGNIEKNFDHSSVTHHSPVQVLKNFKEIKFLRIELPSGELGIDDCVLLKWRADFGSTLDNCVILGASSIINNSSSSGGQTSNYNTPAEPVRAHETSGSNNSNHPTNTDNDNDISSNNNNNNTNEVDSGSIPESFYMNGGLKLRVVWTISSLIAASARHYLLQPIIAEHKTLDSLILTDVDGQGVLCMNKEQLEELRVKPLSASSASKRTLVPALNMRLWYAPHLEFPDGTVLKGATLVAIRPNEQQQKKNVDASADGNWLAAAFGEPYGTAARMLVKRRTYCLEMNSF